MKNFLFAIMALITVSLSAQDTERVGNFLPGANFSRNTVAKNYNETGTLPADYKVITAAELAKEKNASKIRITCDPASDFNRNEGLGVLLDPSEKIQMQLVKGVWKPVAIIVCGNWITSINYIPLNAVEIKTERKVANNTYISYHYNEIQARPKKKITFQEVGGEDVVDNTTSLQPYIDKSRLNAGLIKYSRLENKYYSCNVFLGLNGGVKKFNERLAAIKLEYPEINWIPALTDDERADCGKREGNRLFHTGLQIAGNHFSTKRSIIQQVVNERSGAFGNPSTPSSRTGAFGRPSSPRGINVNTTVNSRNGRFQNTSTRARSYVNRTAYRSSSTTRSRSYTNRGVDRRRRLQAFSQGRAQRSRGYYRRYRR